MAAADTCCVTRVEARLDPRGILKGRHREAYAMAEGGSTEVDTWRASKAK